MAAGQTQHRFHEKLGTQGERVAIALSQELAGVVGADRQKPSGRPRLAGADLVSDGGRSSQCRADGTLYAMARRDQGNAAIGHYKPQSRTTACRPIRSRWPWRWPQAQRLFLDDRREADRIEGPFLRWPTARIIRLALRMEIRGGCGRCGSR
jgi:hypothetical protein